MDQGTAMSKPTGLSNFVKRPAAVATLPIASPPADTTATVAPGAEPANQPSGTRVRGKKPYVAMSFRLTPSDWERVHQLAVADRTSINALVLRGLSRLFEERGLPGIGQEN
jgi:hypothetical protein